jgi:hypothetical protein
MPLYRIYRMKDLPRQQFRWAPHTSGATVVKPKDYEPKQGEAKQGQECATVEALSPYAAWVVLRGSATPLDIGDILETEGELRILKYVGFEEARWYVPEPAAAAAAGDHSPVSGEAGATV